ncbi:uncharacterized protein P884DRAFT_257947 [Thermothelomyces heterothallicus CBS 202.75]|uniref:uncharacterized protein n=1 Tax=Thermothelomyces heterothallicus CBS 202.75 TaxID=1149848 RepID=UPI003742CFD4
METSHFFSFFLSFSFLWRCAQLGGSRLRSIGVDIPSPARQHYWRSSTSEIRYHHPEQASRFGLLRKPEFFSFSPGQVHTQTETGSGVAGSAGH